MQDVVRIYIVEDDPLSAKQLSDWVRNISNFDLIGLGVTGFQAIQDIIEKRPEVVFCDIELPDMSAFEILEKLPTDIQPYIIFTTAHNEHALKAFEVSALDYLLKPFDEERFKTTVHKITHQWQNDHKKWPGSIQDLLAIFQDNMNPASPLTKTIPIKTRGKIHFVEIDHIEYVQASSYYIEVFSEGKKYLIREALKDFLLKLPDTQFVRIHRSVVINLHLVKEIEKVNKNDYQVKLKNDRVFRISKSYRKHFFEVCRLEN